MYRNRHRTLRMDLHQSNPSTCSLEGMEQPVRSFKSFVKTTAPPPPRATQKTLPGLSALQVQALQTPATPDAESSCTSHARESMSSWKAPANWCNDYADMCASPGSRPVLTQQMYTPPPTEASELDGVNLEVVHTHGPVCSLVSEGMNDPAMFLAPRTPPATPLPARPMPAARHAETQTQSPVSPQSLRFSIESESSRTSGSLLRTMSPVHMAKSRSSTEKAHDALGISTRPRFARLQHVPRTRLSSGQSLVSSKKTAKGQLDNTLGLLGYRDPIIDDHWEDTDMCDQLRQLGFSHDYHNLLADQYLDMKLQDEDQEANHHLSGSDHASRHNNNWAGVLGGREVRLPKLAGQRISASVVPEGDPRQVSNRPLAASLAHLSLLPQRIASWVPQHLKATKGANMATTKPHRSQINEAGASTDKSWQAPQSYTANQFNSCPHVGLETTTMRPGKSAAHVRLLSESTATLLRLPGGLAVVRRAPDEPPVLHTGRIHALAEGGSMRSPHSITGPTSDEDMLESPVAPNVVTRGTIRTSTSSSYSQHSDAHESSRSYSPHTSVHELAVPGSSMPLPFSSSLRPPSPLQISQARAGDQNKSSDLEGSLQRTGLVRRTNVARREYSRRVRQARLKKSITLLGPTDPGVVAGYIRGESPPFDEHHASILSQPSTGSTSAGRTMLGGMF